MPILSYFSVVGAALFGLLLVANATLPARGPLAISTEFHGIAAAMSGMGAAGAAMASKSGTIASGNAPAEDRSLAPEPDMQSAAVQRASEGAPRLASVPNLEPVNSPSAAAEPAPKKRKPASRSPAREWRDQYAQAQEFDWNWGGNRRDEVRRSGSDFWRNNGWQNNSQNSSWQNDSRRDSRREDSRRSDRRWGW